MGIRLVAGRFSKAERVRQRSKIQLEDAALSPQTQQRYLFGFADVTAFY